MSAIPTPIQLNEDPELAALWTLKTNLQITERVLLAIYPDCRELPSSEPCRAEQEAYANAILYQIDTLEALLAEYVESIRRLRQWRNREPSGEEVPF